MDDKLGKVVRGLVKELEVALKTEKKSENLNAPPLLPTPEDYVTCYLSGQIPLVPKTMELIEGDKKNQIKRVFMNLAAVAKASGGSLSDITKLNIYLTDLSDFPLINEIMPEYFSEPYPARAVVGVASLPKGATIEMDAIMMI